MQRKITVTDLLRNFSDYINRVAYGKEDFLLVRGRIQLAELRPAPLGCKANDLKALLKQLPKLGDEQSASFASDLKESRKELNRKKITDVWE